MFFSDERSSSFPFLSPYPFRYDDCTDQLLDTDALLLPDSFEFGIDLLAQCLYDTQIPKWRIECNRSLHYAQN